MPAEQRVSVSCDAPHCEAQLEALDGRLLFDSLEDAMAVADERDWLVTHEVRDSGTPASVFCPTHWHRQFGARTPYWGVKLRRHYR